MIISKRKYHQLLIDIRNLKIILEESREYGITCDKCISRLSSDNNKLTFSLYKLGKEYKDKIKLKNKKIKSLKEQIEYIKSDEYLNQVIYERDFLQEIVDSEDVEYKLKLDKINEQVKLVEDAEMNEYNFCKFIENIQNILQGSDKDEIK